MGMKRLRNQHNQRGRLFQSIRTLPDRLFKPGWGLNLESGRSLPAALITLAVGSLLLTPFLSFVSSRALGTSSAAETFNEQYASDAGIEFGIWSLLNNPAFRTQVDINAGIAQPLAFPSPINSYTPTLSVTGLPIGSWYLRQFAPLTINSGGSLAYVGGDRVYGLRGNSTTTFDYYDIAANQWVSRRNTPESVGPGGDLVYTGGNFLYALSGNNKKYFLRYNIAGNSWEYMPETDKKVKAGGALAYSGGYIYALQGNSRAFWRYDISDNSWADMADTLNPIKAGGDLVAVGGDIYAFRGGNNPNFYKYNISSSSWSSLQNAPGGVSNGGSLAYFSGGYIYALAGNSTGFWRYTVTMNNWTVLTDTPSAVGLGGALEFTHSQGGFALRGGDNADFWEFEVTPPRYDISSQAGSVDTDARFEIDGSTYTILFWDID